MEVVNAILLQFGNHVPTTYGLGCQRFAGLPLGAWRLYGVPFLALDNQAGTREDLTGRGLAQRHADRSSIPNTVLDEGKPTPSLAKNAEGAKKQEGRAFPSWRPLRLCARL